MSKHNQRTQIYETMLKVFADAAKQRNKRQDFVSIPYGTYQEPAWVLYERDQMFDAVTRERAKLGKGPVCMTDVVRIENSAKGHSDYARKFALYCTELVLVTP